MSTRPVVLALVSLFAAATAHAQAPGEWQPPADPHPAPPTAASPDAPTLAQRWSINLGVGGLRVADGMSGSEAAFEIGQLALRYRPGRHLEIELSGAGGRERYEDGTEGSLAVATVTVAARYRFNPERHWNWWLLAGLGGTTIAPHDASDQVVEDAQRGHGVIGAGIEHRWTRFAIQAELRAYALGNSKAENDAAERYGRPATTDLGGGYATFGASYYF